jgi:hypothetical protein
MKKYVLLLVSSLLLVACSGDDDNEPAPKPADTRTILVYMAAENNLDAFAEYDIAEMKEGSKTLSDDDRLIIYYDNASTDKPYLARVKDGLLIDKVEMEESIAADPALLEKTLRTVREKYPATSYGLVLWGHASGWLISNDTLQYNQTRGYGYTKNNQNIYWMNIPSMAKALSHVPHLDFIFFDCCHMACIENAYELRQVTDYIIGSPAEIPGVGAPYQTVVPAMMEKTSFYSSIIDRYYEQRADGLDVPLAAIKTSEVANLTSATRTVLKSIADSFGSEYPDVSGLIHYYNDRTYDNMYYDMNDFILKFASADNYKIWKQAYDKTVVYKKMAERWMTNRDPYIVDSTWKTYYGDFEMTEARFGGVSMFVPQWRFRHTENLTIQQMGWYWAAGYNEIGW